MNMWHSNQAQDRLLHCHEGSRLGWHAGKQVVQPLML